MMMPFSSVNPLRVFAVRAVASLDVPETKAEKKKLRTALLTTLTAAGIEASAMGKQAKVDIDAYEEHVLLVWYDIPCDALRIFAPTRKVIDSTSEMALALLNGQVHDDITRLPIEDLDALIRVLALTSGGGHDARDLYIRTVLPNLSRYDDDFTPPSLADLQELWGAWFKYYVGGTSATPSAVEAWIGRAYAFGSGAVPPARLKKPAAAPSPRRRARANAK